MDSFHEWQVLQVVLTDGFFFELVSFFPLLDFEASFFDGNSRQLSLFDLPLLLFGELAFVFPVSGVVESFDFVDVVSLLGSASRPRFPLKFLRNRMVVCLEVMFLAVNVSEVLSPVDGELEVFSHLSLLFEDSLFEPVDFLLRCAATHSCVTCFLAFGALDCWAVPAVLFSVTHEEAEMAEWECGEADIRLEYPEVRTTWRLH